MTANELAETLQKCKSILQTHYRSRFRGLVLFGSAARGEAGPESDIDLLVLLDGLEDYFRELRTIVDLLYPIQLESERLISAKPAPMDDFEQGRLPLYRIVRREGVWV